jgi:hypothetical protein
MVLKRHEREMTTVNPATDHAPIPLSATLLAAQLPTSPNNLVDTRTHVTA